VTGDNETCKTTTTNTRRAEWWQCCNRIHYLIQPVKLSLLFSICAYWHYALFQTLPSTLPMCPS
jgi:hypothetical protein